MLVHPEVADALDAGRPVVALESTIISHGLPRPDNLRIAREIEDAVRAGGAVPATIAVVDGAAAHRPRRRRARPRRERPVVVKVSVRDLADHRGARRASARRPSPRRRTSRPRAGIRVFATGGLGGVHRGARGDLGRVGRPHDAVAHPVLVVCAGREVDPRRRRDARAARDAERRRARLPHRPLPRLLPARLRVTRCTGGRRPRRGRRRPARAGPTRHRRVRARAREPDRRGRRARPRPARPRRCGRARRGRRRRRAPARTSPRSCSTSSTARRTARRWPRTSRSCCANARLAGRGRRGVRVRR